MKQEYKIALMTEKDIPVVAEIEKECISQPWSEKAFMSEMKNNMSIMLCAYVGRKIAGFLTGSVVLDEVSINNVAVDKTFRRKGVGQALLNDLEKRVKDNASFITLEVRESNTPAENLYSSLGYETVGIRKSFYIAPKENAVLMTKYFDKPVNA